MTVRVAGCFAPSLDPLLDLCGDGMVPPRQPVREKAVYEVMLCMCYTDTHTQVDVVTRCECVLNMRCACYLPAQQGLQNFPWRGEVGRLVTHETDTRVPLASPEEMCVRGAAKMAARLYATRCKIRGLHRALSRVVRSSYKYT